MPLCSAENRPIEAMNFHPPAWPAPGGDLPGLSLRPWWPPSMWLERTQTPNRKGDYLLRRLSLPLTRGLRGGFLMGLATAAGIAPSKRVSSNPPDFVRARSRYLLPRPFSSPPSALASWD